MNTKRITLVLAALLLRTGRVAIVPASLLCLVTLLATAFTARPAQAQPELLVGTTSINAGAVGAYNAVTGAAIQVPFLSPPPYGAHAMVVDQYNHVFVGGGGGVGEYNATTGATINANFITGLTGAPAALALDGNNHLFVSGFANFDTNIVGEYDATTGATINASFIQEPNPQSLFNPRGLAVDNQNHLFVSNENANIVGEYDATTGATINAHFINGQGLNNPHTLLLDGLGHLLVGDDYTTATVGMYDATTGATINAAFVPGNGFGGTHALAMDGNHHLFVSNYINSVGEYDATTGATINETFVTGLQDIEGLAFIAPVPEPATFVLAALGFLNVIVWRRRGLLACLLIVAATLVVPEARADVAYAWGDNVYGQLGDGTQIDRNTPAPVTGLASGVTAVAAGTSHSLALQNGGVYAWGYDSASADSYTPVAVSGLASGVTAIAAGDLYSVAVQNGGVYAWGYNGDGELGDGTTNGSPTPVAVIGLMSGVTSIAAGANHNLAVQNGGVYAWGVNNYGQLGNGTTTNSSTPVAVSGLSSGVTAIAAGETHSLAVQNGGVYAWGADGTTNGIDSTPVAVTGLASGVTSIAGGSYFSLAVKDGGVYAWGFFNSHGDFGDGTTIGRSTPEQIDPADLHNIIEVAAGGEFSYALSSDGSLWDWGYNGFGQLGLGTQDNSYLTPQHLLPPSGYMFTSIDAESRGEHAVATLAAVPEPTTLVLTVLGFLGVIVCTRRRELHAF